MINKYFKRISVSSASFPAISAPNVSTGFPGSISLISEGTGVVEYSFDGTNVHGDLVPTDASSQIVFQNTGLDVIWLRLKSGATTTIRVEASDGGLSCGVNNLSVMPNFTAGAPIGVTAMGAYDFVNDDVKYLSVSDDDNGLLVSIANASIPVSGNTNDTIISPLGSRTSAGAVSVVVASDQTSIPVTIAAGSAVIGHVITDSGSLSTVSQATASSLNAQVVGTAAAGATASGNPVQIGGVYNSSAPTASTGQMEPLQLDVNGNLKDVEQYAPQYENNTDAVAMTQYRAIATNTGAWSLTSSVSAGVGTSGVSIKASGGRVRSIRVSNANATTGFFLQLFNKATAAVNNDVPVDRIWVPSVTIGIAGQPTAFMDFGPEGLYLGTGISIAASSTIGLLTLILATDAHYSIKWI